MRNTRSLHLITWLENTLNVDPNLSDPSEVGLITPNERSKQRGRSASPLGTPSAISDVKTSSITDLASFDAINIPIAFACDRNQRKELNPIKRSKGFYWGSGAINCAYWKGSLLKNLLLDSAVPFTLPGMQKKRYWVNLEGSDELSEGKYATSGYFEHVMKPQNDVVLAYEMNNVPLPSDHGYPLPFIISRYVGTRYVK